jgi:Tfp pilus assembly protein PilW
MNKKSLTLLEIIVATVILALVISGLANIFLVGKRYILGSHSRITSGELGKYFLDPLQNDVNQATWTAAGNCLGTGNCPNEIAGVAQGLDRDYTANYSIINNPTLANLKRVKVDITWMPAE